MYIKHIEIYIPVAYNIYLHHLYTYKITYIYHNEMIFLPFILFTSFNGCALEHQLKDDNTWMRTLLKNPRSTLWCYKNFNDSLSLSHALFCEGRPMNVYLRCIHNFKYIYIIWIQNIVLNNFNRKKPVRKTERKCSMRRKGNENSLNRNDPFWMRLHTLFMLFVSSNHCESVLHT